MAWRGTAVGQRGRWLFTFRAAFGAKLGAEEKLSETTRTGAYCELGATVSAGRFMYVGVCAAVRTLHRDRLRRRFWQHEGRRATTSRACPGWASADVITSFAPRTFNNHRLRPAKHDRRRALNRSPFMSIPVTYLRPLRRALYRFWRALNQGRDQAMPDRCCGL